MVQATETSDNKNTPRRDSLRRFLGYVVPYRGMIAAAIACGVVRYLVPLALPWTVKILVDDFFPSGGRPHAQLHWLMAGLA